MVVSKSFFYGHGLRERKPGQGQGQRLKTCIPLMLLFALSLVSSVEGEDYRPRGEMVQVDGFYVYRYGGGKIPMIVFHDIFGLHPKMQMIMDQIAEKDRGGGFTFIMPDFCKPIANSETETADSERQVRCDELSWDAIKPQFQAVMRRFQGDNATKVGVMGFCYSAPWVIFASRDFPDKVGVTAIVHPYNYKNIPPAELERRAADVKSPMIILPSSEEGDMLPFVNVVKANVGEDKVRTYYFSDLPHGFAGNNGDLEDPKVIAGRQKVVELVADFICYINNVTSCYTPVSTTSTATTMMTMSNKPDGNGTTTSTQNPDGSGGEDGGGDGNAKPKPNLGIPANVAALKLTLVVGLGLSTVF